jgi:hypothetical protein
MGKEEASLRRARTREYPRDYARDDESLDVFEVPAAVVCAICGQPECAGCSPAREDDSGVVTIVPWERPGAGVWTRLWSTASASTQGAESFFASLPDGELRPAVRFAILAEMLAILSMLTVLAGMATLALPTLAIEILSDTALRATLLRGVALSVPLLAAWMVVAHTTHGAILDVGARRQGARPQRRRAFRFGLYACGWDLMTGPLGAVVVLASKGRKAMFELVSLSMNVPGKASTAFLRGVYGLSAEKAARARRLGSIGALVLAILSGGVVVAIVFSV